jgi:hypothetical protein
MYWVKPLKTYVRIAGLRASEYEEWVLTTRPHKLIFISLLFLYILLCLIRISSPPPHMFNSCWMEPNSCVLWCNENINHVPTHTIMRSGSECVLFLFFCMWFGVDSAVRQRVWWQWKYCAWRQNCQSPCYYHLLCIGLRTETGIRFIYETLH